MLLPLEADRVLVARLAEKGVSISEIEYGYHGDGRDAPAVCEAFNELAHEPLEPWVDASGHTNFYRDGDLLTLSASSGEAWRERAWEGFDSEWPQVFQLELQRLMSSEDEAGEHLAILILRVTLEFELTPALRKFAGTSGPAWVSGARVDGVGPTADGLAARSVDDWIARVEASDVFRHAVETGARAFHIMLDVTGD